MSTSTSPLEVRLGFNSLDDARLAISVLQRVVFSYDNVSVIDLDCMAVLKFHAKMFTWTDWNEFQNEFPEEIVTFSIYPNTDF